jgi:hypothetical protein
MALANMGASKRMARAQAHQFQGVSHGIVGREGDGLLHGDAGAHPNARKKGMRKHRRTKGRKSHRAYRRNPGRGGEYDPHAAHELELYIDNDAQLHRSSFTPIIANLVRKMKKGTYKPAMAAKLWAYHIKRGADKYVKEFGSRGDTVSDLGFNKATRDKLAVHYEETNRPQVEDEAGMRYKSNPARRRRRTRRNPAPSVASRHARLERYRDSLGRGMANRASISRRDKRLRGMQARNRKRLPKGGFGPTPSLSYIESATHEDSPHFFDRKTMKFFGQRKSDFKVMKSKLSGRVFIGAPSRTHRGMYTLREFTGSKLRVVSGSPAHWVDVRDWVNRQ